MTINNRGLAGQPSLPYVDNRSYAGVDVYMDLVFLDYTQSPVVPVSLEYRVDDLTNAQNVIPRTMVPVPGSQMTLHIPGDQLQLTHYWQGSEIFQILTKAILPDNSVIKGVSILELIAIQTPFGE